MTEKQFLVLTINFIIVRNSLKRICITLWDFIARVYIITRRSRVCLTFSRILFSVWHFRNSLSLLHYNQYLQVYFKIIIQLREIQFNQTSIHFWRVERYFSAMIASGIVLFQLFYIIPSILLYIIEVYVMFFGIHKSQFNTSSFNKIFFIYGINNVFAEILYYFFFRTNCAPIFSELFEKLLGDNICLALLWQLLFHTSMVTNLLDLVLSFNRLTAVLIPLRYRTLWKGKIRWVVAFIVVIPYICFWNFPFRGTMMAYDNVTKEYNMISTKLSPLPWPNSASILGTCVTLACVMCFFSNVYVGFKLYKRRYMMTDSNYEQEKVYFFFIMCVFTTQLLSCSTQVTLFWIFFEKLMFQWMLTHSSQNINDFIMRHQFVIADLGSLLPSWALLLTNSALKKVIFEFISKNPKESSKVDITMPTVAIEQIRWNLVLLSKCLPLTRSRIMFLTHNLLVMQSFWQKNRDMLLWYNNVSCAQ